MPDEFGCVLMLAVTAGAVSVAAMLGVLPVSRRMHGMMASAVFLMHAVMMGMVAVVATGTVCAMGA